MNEITTAEVEDRLTVGLDVGDRYTRVEGFLLAPRDCRLNPSCARNGRPRESAIPEEAPIWPPRVTVDGEKAVSVSRFRAEETLRDYFDSRPGGAPTATVTGAFRCRLIHQWPTLLPRSWAAAKVRHVKGMKV